jgi:hypothetical protein
VASAVIYSLSPLTLNSTTLGIANLKVSPSILKVMHRTGGNEFPSVYAVTGATPSFSFQTPYYEAYNLIGLKSLKCTVATVYLAKFVDAIRSASSVHAGYALASSALGFAYIKSIAGSLNGIVMAEVEVMLLSSDGMTHPWVGTNNNALPSLGSQPALRTIGPCKINGTAIGGATSVNVDLGASMEALTSDGDLYPRVCAYKGGDPVIKVEHSDPETLRGTLGFTGAAITANFVQYFKTIDPTTQIALTTADTLTVASARVIPEDWSADNLGIAKGGMSVGCLSTSGTHPIIVATGATAPTP